MSEHHCYTLNVMRINMFPLWIPMGVICFRDV